MLSGHLCVGLVSLVVSLRSIVERDEYKKWE